MDPDDRISSRLKVSDLRLLHAVVKSGSMAKAAAQLHISQPAVSKAIAALEHTLGIRLLDRNSRGVETTLYRRALPRRGVTIFDELRQGVNDIESLNDPSAGEIRIGATAAALETLLPVFIRHFSQQYPRVRSSFRQRTPQHNVHVRSTRSKIRSHRGVVRGAPSGWSSDGRLESRAFVS